MCKERRKITKKKTKGKDGFEGGSCSGCGAVENWSGGEGGGDRIRKKIK